MTALTARGVRAMLTRSGVDHSQLDITADLAGSVIVRGPQDARRQAWLALFDRGLTVAPYPGYDIWSRR